MRSMKFLYEKTVDKKCTQHVRNKNVPGVCQTKSQIYIFLDKFRVNNGYPIYAVLGRNPVFHSLLRQG